MKSSHKLHTAVGTRESDTNNFFFNFFKIKSIWRAHNCCCWYSRGKGFWWPAQKAFLPFTIAQHLSKTPGYQVWNKGRLQKYLSKMPNQIKGFWWQAQKAFLSFTIAQHLSKTPGYTRFKIKKDCKCMGFFSTPDGSIRGSSENIMLIFTICAIGNVQNSR